MPQSIQGVNANPLPPRHLTKNHTWGLGFVEYTEYDTEFASSFRNSELRQYAVNVL